jgi:HAD superfamily hydrolase (TIGR01484 family)
MRYLALACDYDGTLAHHGRVSDETLAALDRLAATGRKLVMVTGRELPDLKSVFPQLDRFDRVVAENGALIYNPATKEEKVLAERPPDAFAEALRAQGVFPLSVGRVIVATWHPHEAAVFDVIQEQGLELHVIFNKGAVMVLPTGVTKATGLAAALDDLGLTAHEVVGVGDAENDHAFLAMCECSVAVANALPALKARADVATAGDHGVGVAEMIDRMIANDLADLEPELTRHDLPIGTDATGRDVTLPPYGPAVLIAGPSASGKSSAVSAFLERLADRGYQFCVIDPEGDYETLPFAITLGGTQNPPGEKDVMRVLAHPKRSVVVNLTGLRLADRPPFFAKLLSPLFDLHVRTARPHWLVVDEAHHLLPPSRDPAPMPVLPARRNTMFVTVHPDQVHAAVLAEVGTFMATGASAGETIATFCRAVGIDTPTVPTPEAGEILVWRRDTPDPPVRLRPTVSRTDRRRHTRKYAEGELPPDRSFYFRGPDHALNLRAQNLVLFLQIAYGVDDRTWMYHLQEGDYSRWFREEIKDEDLAVDVEAIEQKSDLPPLESRQAITQAVEKRYTLPAKSAPSKLTSR